MRVATWNVNGIRARFAEVVELAGRHAPDVLCLQEIKATADKVPEPLTGLPDYHSVWHGGPRGYSGVSLHLRRDHASAAGARTDTGADADTHTAADRDPSAPAPAPRFSPPALDIEHRALELVLGDLRVLSLYVPNGNRNLAVKLSFLEDLISYTAETHAAGHHLLLCGDLNVARSEVDVHPRMRSAKAVGQLPEERALFQRLLDQGLVDLGRQFDPDNTGLYTWWPPWREERRKNRGWRLDYILASRALATQASSCRVLADFGTSDHAPVEAELALTGPPTTPRAAPG